jgi:hypothetical protein
MASKDLKDPSLFDDDPQQENDQPGGWYLLSSNWSVGSLLARGALTAPVLGEPTDVPFFDERADELLVHKRAFPRNWVEGLRSSRKNLAPIAVRLAGKPTNTRIAGWRQAICLDEVDALVFEEDKALKSFKANRFADYDLERLGIGMRVDQRVFAGQDEVLSSPSGASSPCTNDARLHEADCRAALAMAILSCGLGTDEWVDAFRTVWTDEQGRGTPSLWASAMLRGIGKDPDRTDDLETGLLAATMDVLTTKYPLATGWPASEILEEVLATLGRWVEAAVLVREQDVLEAWANRSREVIEARRELPSMLDDKRVTLRAVMLLLARGEVESLMGIPVHEAPSRADRVGPTVKALAVCLAAARTGLRACPSDLKHGMSCPKNGASLRTYGRRFLEWLGTHKDSGRGSVASTLRITRRTIRPLVGEWILETSKGEFARKPVENDPALVQVESMARQLGYEFDEGDDGCLRTSVTLQSGEPQTVYISLIRQHPHAPAFVRFWSVVRDLSLKKPTGGSRLSGALVNKLPKDYLLKLLKRNSSTEMSCRFALSDELGALIVVVDQLTSSLDEQELRQHIDHVAEVAANA